jgi:hypothetical protein
MFIDGMLGRNFPKALSFYLSRHEEYLDALKKMVWSHEPAERGGWGHRDKGRR